MRQTATIIENGLPRLIYEIDRYIKAGWEIDPDVVPNQVGFSFEVGMVREVTEEQLAEENKPSRAEILAKARAAKAAKREE